MGIGQREEVRFGNGGCINGGVKEGVLGLSSGWKRGKKTSGRRQKLKRRNKIRDRTLGKPRVWFAKGRTGELAACRVIGSPDYSLEAPLTGKIHT